MSIGYVLATTAGGTGRHVAMLADGCSAAGVGVTVYAPAGTAGLFFPRPGAAPGSVPPGSVPPGPATRDVRFVPVGIGGRPHLARDAVAVRRLRRMLTASRHDVVHAHGLRAGALTALALAGTRRRPPLLVTVHNAPPAGAVPRLVYGLLERIVARRADAVNCVSGDLAARMGRLGARDAGRALVPVPPAGPPAPAAVAAVRGELGADGRPLVLAVGRLTAQKGFATLLRAAARWQDRDPVPLLAIAGDGPLARSLRARAARRGLAVRFLGHRGDVPVLLAAADVVVVPSRWEGQPLVVQEALRAGRPIAAFRVGGIPGLTGEDGALLVPPGDVGRLASAVLALLDDPGLAAGLAAVARERAVRLPTGQDAVVAVLALYARLAAQGVSAGRPWPSG